MHAAPSQPLHWPIPPADLAPAAVGSAPHITVVVDLRAVAIVVEVAVVAVAAASVGAAAEVLVLEVAVEGQADRPRHSPI